MILDETERICVNLLVKRRGFLVQTQQRSRARRLVIYLETHHQILPLTSRHRHPQLCHNAQIEATSSNQFQNVSPTHRQMFSQSFMKQTQMSRLLHVQRDAALTFYAQSEGGSNCSNLHLECQSCFKVAKNKLLQ